MRATTDARENDSDATCSLIVYVDMNLRKISSIFFLRRSLENTISGPWEKYQGNNLRSCMEKEDVLLFDSSYSQWYRSRVRRTCTMQISSNTLPFVLDEIANFHF